MKNRIQLMFSEEVSVAVRNLTKRYGYSYGVKDVSFEVFEGEIFGIFGPNGAGKTTLLKLIATIMRPTDGEIYVQGIDAQRNKLEVKKLVGFQSHRSFLYDELTGRENLRFFAKLYGLTERRTKERIESLVDLFGITRWRDEPVYTLSRGLRKRFDLARALLHNPRVILVDEPFAELDAKSCDVLLKFIKEQRGDRTILVSSANLRWIKKAHAEVIRLDNGLLSGILDPGELEAN